MLKTVIIALSFTVSPPRGEVKRVGDDLYVVDGKTVVTYGCTVAPRTMLAEVESDGWLAFSGPEGEGVEARCRLLSHIRRYR